MDKERSTEDGNAEDFHNLVGVAEDLTSPIVEDYLKLLTDRELFIVKNLVDGYNQPQIGEMLGMTKQGVSWIVKGIKTKVNIAREKPYETK